MMQAYYVLIIALFALLLFSVKSLSSTKNNNNNKPISFGSIVENDLLGKTDSNLSGVGSGTSRKKDHNDGTTNKFGWNCKPEDTHVYDPDRNSGYFCHMNLTFSSSYSLLKSTTA